MIRDQQQARAAAVTALLSARKAALMTHVNPDGDTLGSALALAVGLRQLGAQVKVCYVDDLPTNLAFLPGYGQLVRADEPPTDVDLIVYVDSSDATRFGDDHSNGGSLRPRKLNIDHHATNRYFGDVNLVDSTAAATGEQVYDLLLALGVQIDQSIATCLLTALVTDTRAFRTPSTTPRTLAIASELCGRGASLSGIVDAVYHNRSFSTLRLWGLALERMKCESGIAWTEITDEMQALAGATAGEGDGVIDLMSSLSQVEAVAVFKTTAGGVKVSLRSTNGLDVASVAALFGGGGHARAAGCLVSGRLAAVQREVVQCLIARAAER
ncbi:MAG: bifunctional oligoribonuclease/PAP phosphatase NrnA [Chloroflexi bacterium]|nr:bifunctional oligoribonuclease/PAP phosphatase NrnA [Chloroflexota bacterium]MCL5109320.1 bifunctional oligoribonuclease/PAP phosphatase NrnA [Chloroflexota bacterium]